MMHVKLKTIVTFIFGIGAIGLLACGCGSSSAQTSVGISSATLTNNTTVAQTTANGNESVSISLDQEQVNPGDSFTIDVIINTNMASRGAQVALTFDPSALECTGVTEGNFYSTWANANGVSTTMMPSSPAIDNTSGTVEVTAVSIMGESAAEQAGQTLGGAQGQGVFLSYQMTAKSGVNKNAAIKLSDVELLDSNASPINGVVINNGQVTIGTP